MNTASQDTERMARFLAGDKSAKGLFVACVLTTGIYCLPGCPARKPLPQNIVFADTPAEARALGLRACKRCRPDDYYAGQDPDRQQLSLLAEAVRRDPGAFGSVADLADASPWGVTKLAELFQTHYAMSPAAFLTQARAEAAAALLRGPHRGVLDAGFEVGFDSASAFYRGFRRTFGCAPGQYQKRHL